MESHLFKCLPYPSKHLYRIYQANVDMESGNILFQWLTNRDKLDGRGWRFGTTRFKEYILLYVIRHLFQKHQKEIVQCWMLRTKYVVVQNIVGKRLYGTICISREDDFFALVCFV